MRTLSQKIKIGLEELIKYKEGKMNILEAYKLVKEGKIIRIQSDDNVYFILETTLMPFNKKELVKIELGDIDGEDCIPENISDLLYNDLDKVCVPLIISEEYREVSTGGMMSEMQSYWRKQQEPE